MENGAADLNGDMKTTGAVTSVERQSRAKDFFYCI